jgi:hypothetical protein
MKGEIMKDWTMGPGQYTKAQKDQWERYLRRQEDTVDVGVRKFYIHTLPGCPHPALQVLVDFADKWGHHFGGRLESIQYADDGCPVYVISVYTD